MKIPLVGIYIDKSDLSVKGGKIVADVNGQAVMAMTPELFERLGRVYLDLITGTSNAWRGRQMQLAQEEAAKVQQAAKLITEIN